MDIQSGVLTANSNGTNLTINGDYLRAPNVNTWSTSNTTRTVYIIMAGTAAQTLDLVDPVNYVTITNNTTVNIPDPFEIRQTFLLSGTTTTLNINADLNLSNATPVFTIPAGNTVNIAAGKTLIAAGGITVNGTLVLNPGAKISVGNGKTFSIGSGGSVQVNGASGNVASIEGNGGSYTFNIASGGTLSANYFKFSKLVAAGVSVTGSISTMDNGEFHYLASTGTAITVNTGATIPATMNAVGFYDDSAFGNVKNFKVNAGYTGSGTTVSNYSGIGGATYETDPNNKITWGSPSATKLTIINNTANGFPTATIAPSIGPNLFATFAFSLSNVDSYTDIKSITFTNYGTSSTSDIEYIQVFREPSGSQNCAYNAGTDLQVGSNVTFTGTPGLATVTFSAGDVRTTGATTACIHVLVRTSATAQDNKSIGIKIASSTDVTNEKADTTSYAFSDTSGPPVSNKTSFIATTEASRWDGSTSTVWALSNNWSPATIPTTAIACQIGSGVRIPALAANQACKNAELLTGGTLNFASAAHQLQVYGAYKVETGFTFQNATSGSIYMMGSTSQSISQSTTFPGNLVIANTGGSIVNVDTNSTFNGTLTINQGVLRINDGVTLTVLGNITIANTGTLDIQPGGTLKMGDGTTLTVNTGGTLQMVGTASKSSAITLNSGTSGYSVAVDGTIKAQYYSFSKMGLAGIVINSGATIDSTYHLQNGSYTYPMVSSTKMLTLNKQVPTNTMDSCSFDANGSIATGITNIYTNTTAGTLTLNSYTGSWSGPSYENAAVYLLSWAGASNTIDLTQSATGPASVNQGQTYNMGRFAFKQTQAGASYSNTDITSVKLTLTGTGTASDISAVRIYYDSACTSSGGTLLGTGTFSGSPATVTFSGLTGATVQASASTPPTRCIYVQYDISSSAVNANTVGVEIDGLSDVVNSQSYSISGGTPPPVTLGTSASIVGTTTTWTGTTNTAWCTASNWTSGLPTSTTNCVINNVTNDPIISTTCTGVAPTCKSMTNNSGVLTMNTGTSLEIYGSVTNNGTITQTGTAKITIRDDGINATTQSLSAGSYGAVDFNKTAGGVMETSSGTLTISSLTIPGGSNFTFNVKNGHFLVLTGGLSLPAANMTMNIQGGGTLKIPNGQSISVTGGTFKTSGTNDTNPQTLTNKGLITNNGSGTYGFTATSGNVDLTGFLFNYLNTSGLNIGGTTAVTNLKGGQFSYLPTSYSSVKAIQLNTTGSLPATASNIGWNWQAPNSDYLNPPSPLPTDTYTLVSSTGCASQSISFDQWFGDFHKNVGVFPQTKVSSSGCTITIASGASPVSLTSLSSTAYDSAVILNWSTTSELNHLGFNVYRSLNSDSGYVQVNPQLIRNVYSSTTASGNYRYADSNVINGLTYFYRIEDVAINGDKVMHGPVFSIPDTTKGTAPGTPTSVNTGSSMAGADTGNSVPSAGTIATPDIIDLGNGAHILTQTKSSLRIEIIPPPATIATSTWNASYQTIKVPGYVNTVEAGFPEMAERVILVEVPESFTTATLSNVSVITGANSSNLIAPAPSWTANGSGVLQASYSTNSTAYNSVSYTPSKFYELFPNLVTISDKKYVKIKVYPFQWKASNQDLKMATKIVMDIGLGGNAWNNSAPNTSLAISPSAVEGTLRIQYLKSGMYSLTYDDILNAGLDGFISSSDTSQLRLYVRGTEIPMEVISSGSFSSGDELRFYLPFESSNDDIKNEAVLSEFALNGSTNLPLRIQSIDGNPTGVSYSNERGTFTKVIAEENLRYVNDRPTADGDDHLYWARITQESGAATQSNSSFTIPVNMQNHISNSSDPVTLKLRLRGRGGISFDPDHHIRIFVNHIPFFVAEKIWSGDTPTTLNIPVNANYFSDGINNIIIQVVGDTLSAGDTDVIDIDKLEVNYRAERFAISDKIEIQNYRPNTAISVSNFSSPSIKIYDITDPSNTVIVSNSSINLDTDGSYYTVFNSNNNADFDLGFKYLIMRSNQYLKPNALLLGKGASIALRDPINSADFILIGSDRHLEAARELIRQRQSEGMKVIGVSLDRIYSEFSNGTKSAKGIKDFLMFAYTNWTAPKPKFVLFLGDSTYDPRNHLGYGINNEATPVYLEKGDYLDFAGDNWFVATDDGTSRPLMAVGRIPSKEPSQIRSYVQKLLDYESGSRAPTSRLQEVTFVADRSDMGENFLGIANQMSTAIKLVKPNFSTPKIDRSTLGNDATKNAIINTFNDSPFSIAYIGHGAEDMWADASVFSNNDASNLTNTKLPLVMAFNCLNSYFYDADSSYQSLGESMVLNPNGGSIGFWGSTSMTSPAAQNYLATNFFNQFTQVTSGSYKVTRMGELMLQAKTMLSNTSSSRDTIRSYTYIGDPTAKIPEQLFSKPTVSNNNQSSDSSGGFGCGTISSDDRDGNSSGGNQNLIEFIFILSVLSLISFLSKKTKNRTYDHF
jgi:hypothetical protein